MNKKEITYGEVSKKLMPRRKASRTEPMASSSETGPKTLPRGEAPKPTQLSLRPVLPSSRSSTLGSAGKAIVLLFMEEERYLSGILVQEGQEGSGAVEVK